MHFDDVQDECVVTSYLERACYGGVRKISKSQNKKPKKKRRKVISFVALEPSNQPSDLDGGFVFGFNEVVRLVVSGDVHRVVMCGSNVDPIFRKSMEELCACNNCPGSCLQETTPAMLGSYIGVRSAMAIAFRKKWKPEFDPVIDYIESGVSLKPIL